MDSCDSDDSIDLPFEELICDYDELPHNGCIYGGHPMFFLRVISYPLLLIGALLIRYVWVPVSLDPKMVDAAEMISTAVVAYEHAHSEWPAEVRDAEAYIPQGRPWPVNPYDGELVADAGRSEFDPEHSVGMIHYEPIIEGTKQVGFRLHVFGRTRKLKVISEP